MTRDFFRQGGPFNVQKTGPDEYSMSIDLPTDNHGRIARECPNEDCSPGYYKVKNGTGITDDHNEAFCPYCQLAGEPSDFTTKEQMRYATDIAIREAEEATSKLIVDSLGLGSSGKKKFGGGIITMEMSLERRSPRHVYRPFEEDLLRVVVCPHCGLDHAVFGIAAWCPDCGKDIFMEHVKAEYEVVRTMLSDVVRRREALGPRIAARDLENCLEDVVSIFEAVLKAILRRHLLNSGLPVEEVNSLFKERFGNRLQNPRRAEEIVRLRMEQELFGNLPQDTIERLCGTFEKRHPITHNLGVVDRAYLEKAYEAEREGREISVSAEEISDVVEICLEVLFNLHRNIFTEGM